VVGGEESDVDVGRVYLHLRGDAMEHTLQGWFGAIKGIGEMFWSWKDNGGLK